MGAYNLLSVDLKCTSCGNVYNTDLQIKAGEVRQYHYRIGDKLRLVSEQDAIAVNKIMAYGILENEVCPHCGANNPEEYDVFINKGIIEAYRPMEDIKPYLPPNEDNYYMVS